MILKKFLARYAQLSGEVWGEFLAVFNPIQILTLPFTGPGGGVALLNQFFNALDAQAALPTKILAELMLDALEEVRRSRIGSQRVMTVDSALQMIWRIEVEQFADVLTANAPRVIAFSLQVRSLVQDSLLKKLVKRIGGIPAGVLMRSWSTIWFLIERALRWFGVLFYLFFWALLADQLVSNLQRYLKIYALSQAAPRKRFRLVGGGKMGGKILRRTPGGSPP